MNAAEHINAMVRHLAERDQITRTQLVEIIEELLNPWLNAYPEPAHFAKVNEKVHRLLDAIDPQRTEAIDE